MEAKQVYVLGSINTDLAISSERIPEQGETMLGHDFMQSLGGKGCNQAVASAKLGVQTTMIAAVGQDGHGEYALNLIKEVGIDTTHINATDAAHTGTAIILRTDNDNRIILDQGANGHVSLTQVETAVTAANAGDFLLTQFEIPLEIVHGGLAAGKKRGLTTVLNPAPALKTNDEILSLLDIIVLNQVESETLTGIYPRTEPEAKSIASYFFNKGLQLVVVTLGSEGSFGITKEAVIFTPAYEVEVVDTTGAGDAFIGTMLYGLTNELPLQTVLQQASAAGALACTREGAQQALPNAAELQAFMVEKG